MTGPREQLLALTADPAALAGGPPWRSMRMAAPVRRSAVLVLFGALDKAPARVDGPEPGDLDVLLIRRSATLTHHPGQISFPGGGLDDGEDATAAALREAHEEAGLDRSGVEVLGTLDALPLPVSGNLVTPVLAWWTRPSQVAATDPAETVEVFRAPVADLLDPTRRATTTRGTWRSPAFLVDGGTVWGFTAMVLSGLFDALGWARPWDPLAQVLDPPT